MMETGNIKVNQTSRVLFILFGVVPVTVFLGFGVRVIVDFKCTHARFLFWLSRFCTNIHMTVIAIVIVIIMGVSCIIGCGDRVFTVTMAIKMGRVVRILIWVSVPCTEISISRRNGSVRVFAWQTDRLLVQKILGIIWQIKSFCDMRISKTATSALMMLLVGSS